MVYFGWPRAHEDDAVRAIRSGLEVSEAVAQLPAPVSLRTQVGIHTGLVMVGEIGDGDIDGREALAEQISLVGVAAELGKRGQVSGARGIGSADRATLSSQGP